jgi:hypothetical protein
MWAKCEVVIKPMIGAAVTWPIARKRQRAGMRVLKPAIEKARDIELLSNYLPPIFLRLGYLPDGTISTRCTNDTVSALRLSDALGRPNLPSLRLGGPHSKFIHQSCVHIHPNDNRAWAAGFADLSRRLLGLPELCSFRPLGDGQPLAELRAARRTRRCPQFGVGRKTFTRREYFRV